MVRSLACGAQFPAAVTLHMRHHPDGIGVLDRMKNGAHVTPATEETRVDLRAATGSGTAMVRSLVPGAPLAAVRLHTRRDPDGIGVLECTKEGVQVTPASEETLGDLATRGVAPPW